MARINGFHAQRTLELGPIDYAFGCLVSLDDKCDSPMKLPWFLTESLYVDGLLELEKKFPGAGCLPLAVSVMDQRFESNNFFPWGGHSQEGLITIRQWQSNMAFIETVKQMEKSRFDQNTCDYCFKTNLIAAKRSKRPTRAPMINASSMQSTSRSLRVKSFEMLCRSFELPVLGENGHQDPSPEKDQILLRDVCDLFEEKIVFSNERCITEDLLFALAMRRLGNEGPLYEKVLSPLASVIQKIYCFECYAHLNGPQKLSKEQLVLLGSLCAYE